MIEAEHRTALGRGSMVTMIMIIGVLLGALAAPSAAADGARFVDYLYMEPNEGGSSAGHVALAFGDRTYAFQRSPDGRLVLERDATAHVHYLYAVLGNRAVHRSRVAVTDGVFERLRAGFNRRYLIQQRQLALLARLGSAHDLARVLVARARRRDVPATTPDGLRIEAAGYFASGTSGALRALAEAVTAAEGEHFVDRRRAHLQARLTRLAPAETGAPPAPARDRYPADGDRFADRYTAAMSGIVALETLRRAPGLDPDAVLTLADEPLDPAEHAALAGYAARLREELVRLAASARPDFGFPLLVGMARLLALEQTLATGRLVVLDAFPPDARRVPHDALIRTADAAHALRNDACADLRARRRAFTALAAPAERDYARLENAANRCLELNRALAEERDVRIAADPLVPVHAALHRAVVLPAMSIAELVEAERAAATAVRDYSRAVDDLYRYDLVRRNCVTEAFATIDAILGPEAAAALGGRLEPDGGGHFIPALATRAVGRTWRVAASDTTPSYRRARVAALARTGHPVVVRLRESNVLTSTVYRPSDDSTFLFFTDDVLWLRPLLGAANLGVGVGAGLVGLAQAPLDQGAALGAGLRGMLWSLPELVFVNVRKGSFDHVPRHAPPSGPTSRESPPPSPR